MKQKILLILICVLLTAFGFGCAKEAAEEADATGALEKVSEAVGEESEDASHFVAQIPEQENATAAESASQPSVAEKPSADSQAKPQDTTEEAQQVYTEPQIDFSDLE